MGLLLVPKEALRQVQRRETTDSSQRGKLRHPKEALPQGCGEQHWTWVIPMEHKPRHRVVTEVDLQPPESPTEDLKDEAEQ